MSQFYKWKPLTWCNVLAGRRICLANIVGGIDAMLIAVVVQLKKDCYRRVIASFGARSSRQEKPSSMSPETEPTRHSTPRPSQNHVIFFHCDAVVRETLPPNNRAERPM
jgi:hypothetical protein